MSGMDEECHEAVTSRFLQSPGAGNGRWSGLLMLVTGHHGLARSFSSLLHLAGYCVVVARDESSALHMITSRRPSLILIDLALPANQAWRLCNQIKSDLSSTAVMMISAIDDPTEQHRSQLTGADAYYACLPACPGRLERQVRQLMTPTIPIRPKHYRGPLRAMTVGSYRAEKKAGRRAPGLSNISLRRI